MRTILVFIALIVLTPVLGTLVLVAALFGARDREGSLLDRAPCWWARGLLKAAGVRVVVHHADRVPKGASRVYVCNHVSWFDVLALASVLPRFKFVGKAELFRIPLFGQAARAAGMIPIERENRKAAFASYDVAAQK